MSVRAVTPAVEPGSYVRDGRRGLRNVELGHAIAAAAMRGEVLPVAGADATAIYDLARLELERALSLLPPRTAR